MRLPDRLDTVHHVNNVLIQTPGKLTLKELIEAEKSVSGRQMKENRLYSYYNIINAWKQINHRQSLEE